MGVHGNEGTLMFSSIALLRQRFSELERIKEKQEVRLYHILALADPTSLTLSVTKPELSGAAGQMILPLRAAASIQASVRHYYLLSSRASHQNCFGMQNHPARQRFTHRGPARPTSTRAAKLMPDTSVHL